GGDEYLRGLIAISRREGQGPFSPDIRVVIHTHYIYFVVSESNVTNKLDTKTTTNKSYKNNISFLTNNILWV
ncbi:hypothetical protein, partial [Klebsiella pneumoniae]|uniref:hypothetical protein n=1 Tax=Klebsiella pneumoniae TaxID=573 RepID=UPI0040559A4B